jgi:hypothetical protein
MQNRLSRVYLEEMVISMSPMLVAMAEIGIRSDSKSWEVESEMGI